MLPRATAATIVGRLAAALAVASLAGLLGCATYSDRMLEVRRAASAGDYAGSIARIDKLLEVKEPNGLPDEFDSEQALAVLERGTLQQALSQYVLSARDFETADKQLELLDIAGGGAADIGKYVYSDSATRYRGSPTEKLSLNAFNMANYLAEQDLGGARVEAKRFTVMRNYLTDFDPKSAHGAFGSYLAGFAFEQLGEWGSALRYYDEVLQERELESLREPVARIAALSNFRGKRIRPFLESTEGSWNDGARGKERPSQILVVVSLGRVPHKVPERMPIGLAIGYAGTFISGNPDVLAYSAMKFVVYPELVDSGSIYREAKLQIDGRPQRLELASDLGAEIRKEYEALKPKIIGAALSRMIVRAAAAEGARAAGKQAGGDSGQLVGLLAALFTEGALVAMDKPDTRSWEFLPQWIYVHRQTVEPGEHDVEVEISGQRRRVQVSVPKGGYAAVIVTEPR